MSPLALSLLAFAAAAGVLTLTPGVDTAMVLRASAAQGPRSGMAAAIGICLGCLVWGAGAAFGLTALLAASKLAFTIVKWLGATYLAWLGLKLIVKPRASFTETAANERTSSERASVQPGWPASFRRGLLTNLLNPKVGVFYITFLPQFIPPGYNVAAISLLLAGVHALMGLVWLSVLVALTVPLGRFLRQARVVKALDRLTGVVFVGFGVRLALTKAA